MTSKFFRKTLVFAALLIALFTSATAAFAEEIDTFLFTGETKTEKVIVVIDQTHVRMEYQTPSKTYRYSLEDFDYTIDSDGSGVFTAIARDMIFGKEYDVLLVHTDAYTDMRIGSKRIPFTHIKKYEISVLEPEM